MPVSSGPAERGGTMKTWLTVAEGAEYSGVSRDTIYAACERREIRHARISGRRSIRLKREWIDAWLEQHTRGAHDTAPTDVSAPATSVDALDRARPTTVVLPVRGLAQEGRS